MQTIQIDDAQHQLLSDQAAAAGYADIAAYVVALASDAAFDPRGGMSREQLSASAEECDQALSHLRESGGGRDFRRAWQELGKKMGFTAPE